MQTATFKFMPGVRENDPALEAIRAEIERGSLVASDDCMVYGNKLRIVETRLAAQDGSVNLLELVIEYEGTLRFPSFFEMLDRNIQSEPLLVTPAGLSEYMAGLNAWGLGILEEIQERERSENSIALALALLDVTLDPLEAREV